MKKIEWKKVLAIILYVTLRFSLGFSIFKIITTPEAVENATEGTHLRSDYVLMLLQCCLGVVLIGLPKVLERRFSIALPNEMSIAYFIFLYCAIYLGEVKNFYYAIPYWDNILHCFSGGMLGAFGFTLVETLNESEKIHVTLNPYFICLFAFCFALAAGAVWEIYEFSGDSLFGINMQKYRLEDGTLLIGAEALKDTMHDLIIDAAGALVVVIVGLLKLKHSEHKKRR